MKIRIVLNCIVALLLVGLTADYGGQRLLPIVGTLEQQTFDWRLARNAQFAAKNETIVIVDIDRDSLRKIGNWPWHRDTMAQVLDQLFDKYRVRAAAFTFPFLSPDDEGLNIFDYISRGLRSSGFDVSFAVQYQLDRLRKRFDFDDLLVESMNEREVLLGYSFDNSARVEGKLPPPLVFHENVGTSLREIPGAVLKSATSDWAFYRGYAANLLKLLEAASGAGYVNYVADSDGLMRRASLVARHAGRYYESLALALLRRVDNPGLDMQLVASGSGGIEVLRAGRYETPIDKGGEMYFNFRGIGGPAVDFENSSTAVFRYVSVAEVISGKAEEAHLKDKIVLIGSSAGALRDIYTTPLNPRLPGVELLATQLADIIDGQVLRRPPQLSTLALLALLGISLLVAVIFVLLGPVLSFAVTVLLCVGSLYGGVYLWDVKREVVDIIPPLLVFVGLFLWHSISGFVFEWRTSRNLKSSFSKYVPPELAKRIGEKRTMSMEGENREISVLFSDVRNFTAISETFTPQDLTRLMNRMLTTLSEAIHRNHGTVDKFIGDAVMAFWNAPLDDEEHAKNAVLSALDMQRAMSELSKQLEAEGHPPMRMGVGICSGNASVGNMGSKLRMAYTAMGDTVNVASRVEGLTKYYKTSILVTESTYQLCKSSGIIFRAVDAVRVKGREQALHIYEPLGDENQLAPETHASLALYKEMRAAYVEGDFAKARELSNQYRTAAPDDDLGKLYEERISAFLQQPPVKWDGVTNFEVK